MVIQIYLHTLSSIMLICMRLPVFLSEFLISEEYCMSEPFQPRCSKNEVIIMRTAVFGRMRIGRCVKAQEVSAHKKMIGDDPRYFHCSEDVLSILDLECSGRSECDVRLSDISDKGIQPCFPGLMMYLEASYQCKSIADEERSCVLVASADPIHIIGSSISKITCGTESQPWLLEAPAGQRLRISLLDFTASIGDNMGRQTKESCANYGVIIDKSAKSNISICGGGGIRDKEVYVSRGNEISLILTNVNEEKQLGTVVKRFLLAVASLGCSDLIPPEDAWLKRKEDTIVIGCYVSRKTWHLNCLDGNWVGVFGSCSQEVMPIDPVQDVENLKTDSLSDGQVLAMVAIGGLTLAACLIISCVGIICLRRVSARKEKHPECKTIQYSISSTRRQQLDETHALPTDATGFTRNGGVGLPDFVAQQQMPTYSVFVGENGYNAVA